MGGLTLAFDRNNLDQLIEDTLERVGQGLTPAILTSTDRHIDRVLDVELV